MKKVLYTFLLISTLFSTTSFAGRKISFALYHYYPFLLSAEGDKGYAYDIAEKIFKERGYKVNFQFMPLIRAIHETHQLRYDAILGLSPIHSKDLVYSKTPVTSLKFYIWGRNGINWYFRSPEDLKKVKIITISGFNYSLADRRYQSYINKKPDNVSFLSGHNSIERAFKMILKGRGDIFCLDIDQSLEIMRKAKIENNFKKVGELKNIYNGYFGISKSHPKRKILISIFEAGMKKLKRDGTIKKIIQKYKTKYGLINEPLLIP